MIGPGITRTCSALQTPTYNYNSQRPQNLIKVCLSAELEVHALEHGGKDC